MIVSAAFGDFPHSDELTVFVVDEESVAVVESRLMDAGLDAAKTAVQVALEDPPYDPWDWLETEPYVGHDWLESPGPHTLGAWRLVESNGSVPPVPLLAGFGSRWFLDECGSWLGRAITSSGGTITLTVDPENLDCRDVAEAVEDLVFSVIEENEGEFEIVSTGDRMIFQGSAGGSLVWQPDEEFEPGIPVYPRNRSEAHETWARSPAPEMEGIWQLREVSDEEPAAPVSLYVGVSTISFEGQCNDMKGFFAISTNDQIGLSLFSTAMGCSGPTGDVEEQIDALLWRDSGILQLSIDDDTMTWSTQAGLQMIWAR